MEMFDDLQQMLAHHSTNAELLAAAVNELDRAWQRASAHCMVLGAEQQAAADRLWVARLAAAREAEAARAEVENDRFFSRLLVSQMLWVVARALKWPGCEDDQFIERNSLLLAPTLDNWMVHVKHVWGVKMKPLH